MGLDVWLYRIDDYGEYKKQTEKYEALSSAQWAKRGPYDALTDAQKEEARAEDASIAASLGLEENGKYPGEVKIEHASRLYPDHLYKIGYLRSSYNESGIDGLLRYRLNTSLADIFGGDREYEFQPDWQASRDRAIKTLEDWRAITASMGGRSYRVFTASENLFLKPGERIESSADAFKVFQEQLKSRDSRPADHLSFSNKHGDFYLGEPMKVAAMIPGFRWNSPVNFVVVEAQDDDWYTQALEIVIENCEWVLEQSDKELYWLHWSS